ncbi:hypothetical protein [Streptomyces sp. 7N604]
MRRSNDLAQCAARFGYARLGSSGGQSADTHGHADRVRSYQLLAEEWQRR